VATPGHDHHGSGKLLVEELDCPSPCEVGSFLVVARGVGVGVEGVVRPFIDEELVGLFVFLQGGLEGGNARIDALVEPAIVQQQRSLDPSDLLAWGP
jgi:hypothetical protein